MKNPFDLTGKTILVTGASSGIGRACARICSYAGANMIITGRNVNRLQETFNSLFGEKHRLMIADLTNADERLALVDVIDNIDGVILSAGINDKALIKFSTEDFVNKIFNTNFTSTAMLIKDLLKRKKLSIGGSIVIISSISSFYPSISNAMYGATKAALKQYAKVLALEVIPQKIRVNTIEPAFVETEMLNAYALQDNISTIRNNFFNKRFIQPEEIAYACQYLLSDASQMITGADVVIDGGYSIRH